MGASRIRSDIILSFVGIGKKQRIRYREILANDC